MAIKDNFRKVFAKRVHFGLTLVLAVSMTLLCSCSFGGPSEEEVAASSLAAVTQEEELNGYKRLSSPNLTEYEKPLADFLTKVQAGDTAGAADVLGIPCTFTTEEFNTWIIDNNCDPFKNASADDIYVISTKDGSSATLDVFFETPDEKLSNYTEFTSEYDGNKWVLTPPTGIAKDFTFYSPTNKVEISGIDMSAYAQSSNERQDNQYLFTIPRLFMNNSDMPCTIISDLGTFQGHICQLTEGSIFTSSYWVAIADFTQEQIDTYSQAFAACASGVFDLIRTDASKEQFSTYLLDGDIMDGIFPEKAEDRTAVIDSAKNVTSVSAQPGDVLDGYPESYAYHLSSSNSVVMNIKYLAALTNGECHRLATVEMVYSNDAWCIKKVQCTQNLFTDITAFSPEW